MLCAEMQAPGLLFVLSIICLSFELIAVAPTVLLVLDGALSTEYDGYCDRPWYGHKNYSKMVGDRHSM